MNWLLAIAVEAVSCFGLFAIAWQRQASRAAARGADANKPWRLVSGEEAMRARPLLRLPAREEDRTPPRKGKRTPKANGRTRRAAAPRPDDGSPEANA
jgi:hypothetical protein